MKTSRNLLVAVICLSGGATCFAQSIVWDGSGDGISWNNPQNWVGQQVPGPTNAVFITNGAGGNVVISSSVSVESVFCNRALTISNGSLTVTVGASSVEGALTITNDAALSASGSNTTFTSGGPVTADDANLNVSGGAVMTLPALQNYTKNCDGANWEVTGTNSVLNLPGLTNITGAPCNYPVIQAAVGGQILATNLASIEAGPLGFQADGAGSVINLGALATCMGQNGYLITFEASSGGMLDIPNMTGGSLVGVILNPGGNMPTAQIQTLASLTLNGVTSSFAALANGTGSFTVTGVSVSFPVLTNFYDGNFILSGGAVVTAPALPSYSKNCNGGNWTVTGSNSVLNLPALTNITGAACTYPAIEAEAGGQILATNLVSVEAGPLAFQADGSNSLINLSKLAVCAGQANYLVTFEASSGGTLDIPNMTGGPLVGVILNPGYNIPTAQLQTLAGLTLNGVTASFPALANGTGSFTVTGVSVSFPALTNFYDGNFILSGGAVVTAPALQSYSKNCNGGNWTVTGSNSLLNLPALTNITGAACTFPVIQAAAGGQIWATNLEGIQAGPLAFQADGTNSLIDLSALTACSGQQGYYVTFEASAGGIMDIPNMTGGPLVGVTINSNATMQLSRIGELGELTLNGGTAIFSSLTNVSSGSIVLNGGTASFPALSVISSATITANGVSASFPAVSNFNGGNISASGGAVVTLPELGSYQAGCANILWQSTGAGSVVELAGLTNLQGATCGGTFNVQALNGGQMLLSNVVAIPSNTVAVLAQGTNSLVNLSAMTSFYGINGGASSSMQALDGGTILVGSLENLVGVAVSDDTASMLNIHTVTNLTDSSLTVNSCPATITNVVNLSGATLTINGCSVTLSHVTNIDNANLYVNNGATLSLPGVANCDFAAEQTVMVWQANGAGSVLALTGLTNLSVPSDYPELLEIQAQAGGLVNLGGLISISGVVEAQASGAGSEVNLSALQGFGGSSDDYPSELQPSNGGTILTGQLGSLTGASVVLGGGTLNLSTVTNLSYTTLSVTNGTVTLSNVVDVANANLYVSAGATLSLPGVRNCNFDAEQTVMVWQASGAGSVLALTGLTNLSVPSDYPELLAIQAQAGGLVNLDGMISISGVVEGQAGGAGSELNLSALQAFNGSSDNYPSELQTSAGGTILTGPLGSLTGASVVLGAGTLNLSTVTNLSYTTLSVTNGSVTLSHVANIDNANLYVNNGATLSLPGVANCNFDAEQTVMIWQANGVGSVLSLTGLTNLSVPSDYPELLAIQAQAGGLVNLGGLISISGVVEAQASGAGSEVNLSALQGFGGSSDDYPSELQPSNGGTILTGQLGSLTGASVVLGNGTLNLSRVTNLSYTTLSVTNGTVTLSNVVDVANANLYVSGGATLSLPGVVNCNFDAEQTVMVWQANGAGSVLSLTGLTNLSVPSDYPELLQIQAQAGGLVDMGGVTSISGVVEVQPSGSGSEVNLSALQVFNGSSDDYPSELQPSSGGTILTGPLGSLTGATVVLGGGTLNLSAVTNLSYTTLTVSNGAVTLSDVVDVDNANFFVTGGATLSLPGVFNLMDDAVDYATFWQASGSGSALFLTGLTNVVVPSYYSDALLVQALAGGEVNLENLVSSSGPVQVESSGSGSVVNVTRLIHYQPANTFLVATNGGVIILAQPVLTMTANNASMTYGGAVPALSVTYNGFTNGDTSNSLTVAPSVSTTGTSLSHAGTYPITPYGAVDTNYTIVYVPGTLTINPAPLTITASNASKTYGQSNTLSTTAFSSVGLLNGDTIAGVTLTSAGTAPTAGIGSYAIQATNASGPRAGNYSITYLDGTLTVNPASLTITANNTNKYFGKTLVFAGTEFTASGLQNGQTVGSVTLTSAGAVSTATVAGSPYAILPSAATGGTFTPANYTLHYVNGLLTVVPVGTPPTISSVFPVAGPNAGGTTVTINGAGFEPGANVTFASLPATFVTFESSNVLTAITPVSASGTVGVSVINPDGNNVTDPNAFAFGNAPDITTQPTNLTLAPGLTAQFKVQATGDATLVYQWQYDGSTLLNNSRITGTSTATLTISNVATSDDGFYSCAVTNLYESIASTAAVLTVVAPPSSVTVSPPSAETGAGGSVTFTASVSGTPPFSYDWYQNGSLLAGQTASDLNIANAQANASYTVVVSNASGSVTSAPVSLTLLGYCVDGQSTQLTYPEGTNFIPINVVTYNCGSSAPVPNSAAVVWLSIDGTSRNLTVTTDGSGNGTAYFTPLPVEVGLVKYGFGLPGQAQPASVGSFTIIGMNLSAQSESPHLVVNAPQTNTLLLNNLTAVPLTGITATVVGAPANVNVQVSVPSVLTSNGAVQTTYILEATSTSQVQADFSIQYTSAQGATVSLPISATISPPTAQLATSPVNLVAAMIDGSQTLVTFTLTNFGAAPTGPIQVNLPAAPWLSVATAQPIPSLAAGQGGQIMLSLTPTNGQTLGEYTGDLVIQGSNTSITVPYVFTAVSSLKGNLQVTAQDELTIYGDGHPNLSNATVTVSDFLTGTNVGIQVTGSNGMVTFSNLTSAYYTVSVQAPDHGSFGTTLLLAANTTTPVTAFLPMNLVDYTWTVTPTTVPDEYFFTLTTIFVTQVPWPEVSVTPIDLCTLPDCTNQYELVITNAGLIAAEGLQIVINNANPNWSFVALVTNLGNLAAESSLTVPIVLTHLGCTTNAGGPTSIDASLTWYVAALNGTVYNSTPIFIYNANCEPGNAHFAPVSYAGASQPSGSVYTPSVGYTYASTNGAVVNVTLQIDQTAILTANAFHATLSLTNGSTSPVTDLQVNITPVDTNGIPVTNAFFIQPPLLNGLNAVDGTGSLAVNAGGQASWTIVPTTNAAPLGTSNYAIGGSISYMLEGQQVTIPLFPVPITVLPEPQLFLDYFLQHDVYSQDPFASVIEPPIPFALGLRVRNLGAGVADDFTITSAQPVIINNANGLLINFQIISSDVGTNATPVPSLTLDMGDIDRGTNVVGIWWMTASLEGNFTNFQATFQHLDALGGLETSLVQGVKIHEMNHVVEITCPSNDGIPDFLCNDTTNVDALPDDVYSSDGNVYPVTSLTGAVASGSFSGLNSTITISDAQDNIPSGFVYFQLADPSGGQYAITSVKRSDGTELLVGTNVWQTPYRPNMVPPQLTNLIHIFDCNSTGSYSVTYGSPVTPPMTTTLAAENVTPTNATLVGTVNPESGSTEYYFQWGLATNYGNFTPTNWLTANLGAPQEVTAYINNLSPSTTIHFRVVAINSAGTNYGADQTVGTPALPVPMIAQEPNQFLIVGQTLVFTNTAVVATPPVTFSLGGSVPEGASITTNGVFSWTPSCPQGSTTNVITVWATDSGTPPLSNAMTFDITVGECVQLGIGSAVLQVGQSSNVPVSLFSTVGITNLSFSLDVPANRFSNYSFAPSNSTIASASVQVIGSSPLFTLVTQPGQTLPSPSLLGTIGFTALAGDSAFVPVAATNIIGLQSGGLGVGNVTSFPGLITVVGSHPLLGSSLSSNSMITLTFYGTPGSNYQMAYTTNLALTNWQTGATVLLTNVQQNIEINATNAHMYFRLQ